MNLRTQLELLRDNLEAKGFDVRPLVFEPPASEELLLELEFELGHAVPSSLRNVLASVSAGVDFRWFSSSDAEFPAPFEQIFAGSLKWSLDGIRQHQQSKAGWIEAVFPNPNDPYDSVWHNKLAFQDVGNGDYLSLDLSGAGHGQVVYLSHDDGEGHGHVMAESFADLLAHWVPLACVGGEDWQWIPFTDRLTTPINRECVSARAWRDLLSSKD